LRNPIAGNKPFWPPGRLSNAGRHGPIGEKNIDHGLVTTKMKHETKFNVVMIFFMAIFLSLTMSLAMVLIHVGLVDNWLSLWLGDFAIGFVVAFPVSLIVLPVVVMFANTIVGVNDDAPSDID
jgi:hypothetical protein